MIVVVAIAVILALVIGVCFWVWKNEKNAARQEVQNQEQQQNEQKENEQDVIDMSDWKTYRNEEFGFEVGYPKDWEVDVQSHTGGLLPSRNILSKKDIFKNKGYSMEFSFGSRESKAGGYVTGIYIGSKANGSVDDIVKRDFAWENREQVFIQGWQAELLCWKSGCKRGETGIDKRFIFERNDLVWQIFGGVSVEKGSKERVMEIEKFFSSVRFID